MKFFQVIDSDGNKEVFKSRKKAKDLLKQIKEDGITNYENATFDCMEIYIDSDTILNILNGQGYASEIIELDKP